MCFVFFRWFTVCKNPKLIRLSSYDNIMKNPPRIEMNLEKRKHTQNYMYEAKNEHITIAIVVVTQSVVCTHRIVQL